MRIKPHLNGALLYVCQISLTSRFQPKPSHFVSLHDTFRFCDYSAEYAADFNDRMVCVMNEDINRCTLALFALQNYTEMEATGLLIANAYVDYIYKTAKEKVKIYDCEYSKDDSTKSVDSYYIIYTIDEDFYILVRYSEEKKSTRFMIETLSRGKELIEIERKLKNYL